MSSWPRKLLTDFLGYTMKQDYIITCSGTIILNVGGLRSQTRSGWRGD